MSHQQQAQRSMRSSMNIAENWWPSKETRRIGQLISSASQNGWVSHVRVRREDCSPSAEIRPKRWDTASIASGRPFTERLAPVAPSDQYGHDHPTHQRRQCPWLRDAHNAIRSIIVIVLRIVLAIVSVVALCARNGCKGGDQDRRCDQTKRRSCFHGMSPLRRLAGA